MVQPRWERGHRVHGYWLDLVRVGWIGIQSSVGSAAKYGYYWEFETPSGGTIGGNTVTLATAKKAVEKAYLEYARTMK